jgi:hypothetical protein
VYRKRLKRCDKSAIILLMRRDPLKSKRGKKSNLAMNLNVKGEAGKPGRILTGDTGIEEYFAGISIF